MHLREEVNVAYRESVLGGDVCFWQVKHKLPVWVVAGHKHDVRHGCSSNRGELGATGGGTQLQRVDAAQLRDRVIQSLGRPGENSVLRGKMCSHSPTVLSSYTFILIKKFRLK